MARRVVRWLLPIVAAVVGAFALPARAEDAPPAAPPVGPPAAPPGATYSNKDLGLSVEGPSGWRLTEGAGRAPTWTTLATFSDPTTGAQAVLAARKAFALTLP
jgi:hypothetical protein